MMIGRFENGMLLTSAVSSSLRRVSLLTLIVVLCAHTSHFIAAHECLDGKGIKPIAKIKSCPGTTCRSTITAGGQPTFDCAQDDNGVDKCNWANGENGVCRQNDHVVECCCSGALCNDDAMMDVSCRERYKGNKDTLRYGKDSCAAARPTSEPSTNRYQRFRRADAKEPPALFSGPKGALIGVCCAAAVLWCLTFLFLIGRCAYRCVFNPYAKIYVALEQWEKKDKGAKLETQAAEAEMKHE